ncbi:SLA class II histocompatibility antigen, DQ haplotype C alpha chain [Oryzias melastigma]|uniref:SLA class II histocompatibility antigen, DQ haplotype C alpha chain n=1 Tax=Oryzias melastigma TaxID=30732 RepID=A0A834KYF8_ORYME|nr:SLA class II histocompatibility antigen, DQ haplotype C alpha chain [Oryzias melastigma]
MKLLLLLVCGILGASAQVLHEDLNIIGCSDSDGENMYSLDGEEKWYADFKKKTGVEPQPPFVDHTSYAAGTYEQAVANQNICKQNLKICRIGMKDLPLERVPPSNIVVYNRDEVELGEQNTLICHVSGFYPAPVNVSWTKNGEEVTGTINVPYPSSDGTFTQISSLQFVPQLGDLYSCSVEHPALTEVQTKIWGERSVMLQDDGEKLRPHLPLPLSADVEKTQAGVGPAVFCGLGLTVGLLGVAAGTFFLIKGNECS